MIYVSRRPQQDGSTRYELRLEGWGCFMMLALMVAIVYIILTH